MFTSATPAPEVVLANAIEHFQFGEPKEAAEKLRQILVPPKLAQKGDVIVARQYLGACYHLLGEEPRARAEFSMLLASAPETRLDPQIFSPAIVSFFNGIRRDAGLADAPPKVEAVQEAKVTTSPVETPLPRIETEAPSRRPLALAFIPFGVGQFANRHPVRGTLFGVAELGLFAGAAGALAAFNGLKLDPSQCMGRPGACFAPEERDRASGLQSAYLGLFWSGVGVAAIGVIEALISYPSAAPAADAS